MAESFFEPRGDRFVATELTRGPWDPRLMHGGPPAALLGRAMEALAGDGMQIARMTVELLRPLVIGELELHATLTRPGKRVRVVTGALVAGGTEIVRASALAIRTTEIDLGEVKAPKVAVPPLPQGLTPWTFPFFVEAVGYHTAMEIRIARGEFGNGPLTAWMRMRVPLVPGEEPSGLVRTLAAADSSNGLSIALDLRHFTFLNPDLTVCLHRMPVGEWVALEAATTPQPTGIGLAESALFDREGPIGRAVQTLLVEKR
jgi:acyl-Coa thioesterase superfamily protein/acyl-CoA thioesterase superfamily protein